MNALRRCKIGQFNVDFERNQIKAPNGQTSTLEPKVMDLLFFLATHQGEVLDQERIFDHVWGSSTFSPSTIQRAIALLRKAFEESAKTPQFIKTYPKRGYSLIAEVQPESTDQATATIKKSTSYWPYTIALAALLVLGYAWLNRVPVKTEFHHLYPVTTGTQNERDAQYHPSGRFLLFLRDNQQEPGNHIWLKRFSDDKEFKLSSGTNHLFAGITFSPDGNHIAYINKNQQHDIIGYITFDPISGKALSDTKVKTYPKNTVLGHRLQWSPDNILYVIRVPAEDYSELLALHIEKRSDTKLLEASGKDLLQNIALSPDAELLAYTKSIKQNRYEVHLRNLGTGDSRLLTTLENGILGISWHPDGDYLLASNKTTLKLIGTNAEVQEIPFNNYNTIIDANFSPDGKQIVMQSVAMDVDILYSEYPFTQQHKLVDSNAVDLLPSFSPDESQVLFMSNRNGKQQLFITSMAGDTRLIFDNPDNQELFGQAWSPDATKVVTASKDTLYFIDLNDDSVSAKEHGQAPFYIQQWYKNQPALLVSRFENERFIPAQFNYDDGQFSILNSQIETQQCFYMTLDEEDNLLITDGKSIVRLKQQLPEIIWHSKGHKINGFAIDNNELTLIQNEANLIDSVVLSKATLGSARQREWFHYNANDFKVVSGNRDHRKLLMHSTPQMVRRIVKLQ